MAESSVPRSPPQIETLIERLWYAPSPTGFAAFLEPLLHALAALYGRIVRLRGWLYRRGWLKAAAVSARVISVGNLTAGGTGKTPVVIALAERFLARGKRVAVLSRGYGGRGKGAVVSDGKQIFLSARDGGDEPVLIAQRVPGAVVLVGKRRVRIARMAVERFGCEVLLLDDGFQHRALARDEDVVVVGAPPPWGNGALLPAGPLREPPSAAARASVAWLSNWPGEVAPPPGLPKRIVRSRHRPAAITDWFLREDFGLGAIAGRKVLMLAGLARPAGFGRTLRELGAEVVGCAIFGDHYPYAADDLRRVELHARRAGADFIVTTEKDAVRLEKARAPSVPVRVVRVEVEILAGDEVLAEVLGC